MNTEKTFADRLKELRNIRNYTQEELGKITNISVQSIRRYEQGRLNEEPSAYNLLIYLQKSFQYSSCTSNIK